MTEAIPVNNKIEEYKSAVGFNPDALFILSGGVKKVVDEFGQKVGIATTYTDSDNYGMLGGEARVLAAVEIANVFPQIPIYTLSQNKALDQISWQVYAEELAQNGVNPERIISLPDSGTTIDELIQIVKESVRLRLNKVAIITNDYHLSRAGLILDSLEYFATDENIRRIIDEFRHSDIDLRFVSAESILEIKDPEFREFFDRVKETPEAIERYENERKGAYQLIIDPASYANRSRIDKSLKS